MKCVNKNSKEFKELQELTSLTTHTLATRIGSWQEKNNSDLYPSYNELLGLAPGSLSLYNKNPELQYFGSDIEYGQYVNNAQNPTVEGFKEHQGNIHSNASNVIHTTDIVESAISVIKNSELSEKEYTKLSQENLDFELKQNILNGKDFDNVSASDIFESLLSNTTDVISESAQLLLNRMSKVKDIANIPIKFINDSELKDRNVQAYWNSEDNVIYTSKEALAAMTYEDAIRVFLHEFTHPRLAKAVLEPTTAEDHELVKTVREFIDSFGSKSTSYGFTNEMEFVSELYSNPEFAKEVHDLYKSSKKARTLIDKILDAIRRFFNIKKPDKYDKLMETIVFNVEVASSRELSDNHGVFNMQRNPRVAEYNAYLKKIESTQLKVMDAIIRQKALDVRRIDDVNKVNEIIKEADEKIERLLVTDTADKVNIITSYAKELINKASGLQMALDKGIANLSNDGAVQNILDTSKSLDDLFIIIDDVQELITDFNVKFTTSKGKIHPDAEGFGLEEIHNILKESSAAIAYVQGSREHLNRNVTSFIKEAAIRKLKSPIYNSSIIMKYRNMFLKEYHNDDALKSKYSNPEEYIALRMAESKDDIDLEIRQNLESIFSEAYEDMNVADLELTNPINARTKMAQLATILVLSRRNEAIRRFRPINAKLFDLHNKYSKEVSNSLDTKKKFGKLMKKGTDGHFYLLSMFKQEVYDASIKAKEAVLKRLTSGHKAIEVTNAELIHNNEYGVQHLFRDTGSVQTDKGETLSFHKDGEPTYTVATVVDTKTYNSLDTLSKEEKDEFAKLLGFDSFDSLIESKLYASERSKGSIRNPKVYEFLTKNTSIDVISYNKKTLYEDMSNIINEPEYVEYLDKYFTPIVDKKDDGTEYVKARVVKKEYLEPEYNSLDSVSKKTLLEFMSISDLSDNAFNSRNNDALAQKIPGTAYKSYRIPSHNVNTLELRARGEFKKMAKEKIDSLRNTRNEDFDMGNAFNSRGELVYSDKPYFRHKIDEEGMSFSLFDIYAKEAEQYVNRKTRDGYKLAMQSLVHISANKMYKRTHNGVIAKNIYKTFSPDLEVKGVNSNEYKKLKGMYETHFHDITSHNDQMFMGMQATKIAGLINGLAASSALTFNAASGVANVLNGMAQLKLDAFARKSFTMNDLLKAEAAYSKDLPNIIKDLTSAHKTSKTNQLMDIFNIIGGLSLKDQEYIKSHFVNKFASTGMLNSFNDTGEHMMNAVLTMAILNNIKVMNDKHKFIDKNGKVVDSKDKAASLLDMYEIDPKTGLLELHKSVVYSTHAPELTMSSQGVVAISALIKKRASDLFGDYDNVMQGEAMKKWYGKSLMMFKRFFLPGLEHRFRGVSTVMKTREELTEEDKIYSFALRDYDEGYYTTFVRMVIQGARALRAQGLNFIPSYYNSLTEAEKANVRKATAELIMIYVILPTALIALKALMGIDDDDKEGTQLQYFALYQVSRLRAELAQFHNVHALGKMLQNPIAGMRFIHNFWDFSLNLLDPIDWFEEDRRGHNKLLKSAAKITPGVSRLFVDYVNMFNAKTF